MVQTIAVLISIAGILFLYVVGEMWWESWRFQRRLKQVIEGK